MSHLHAFYATTGRGLESVLVKELEALGAGSVCSGHLGVSFAGSIETGYRACLWSRVASAVLLGLGRFAVGDAEELYRQIRHIRWEDHFGPDRSFAVQATGYHPSLSHTGFAALKTKDAIADHFRDRYGVRPSVDVQHPQIRIHLHLTEHQAAVSLNLSGESLHKRGYRLAATAAPLRENLAAAILLLAGWPAEAAEGAPLVDPMCGSGTILIEAAWMAADVAPGLYRRRFGFEDWSGHDPDLWKRLTREAHERRRRELLSRPFLFGFDRDPDALAVATKNVARAGVDQAVQLAKGDVIEHRLPGLDGPHPGLDTAGKPGAVVTGVEGWEQLSRASRDEDQAPDGNGRGPAPTATEHLDLSPESTVRKGRSGLVVTNPPYGQRLGEESQLVPLYRSLGDLLRRRFPGWRAWVLAGNRKLAKEIGLKTRRKTPLFNGDIECRLLEIPISAEPVERDGGPAWRRSPDSWESGAEPGRAVVPGGVASLDRLSGSPVPRTPPAMEPSAVSPGGEMLANRLRKNLKRLRRWIEAEGISCYRVYDADLPEYALAIDRYGDAAVVQEYQPPKTVDPDRATQRLEEALAVLPAALSIAPDHLFFRTRRRQRGRSQYQRIDRQGAVRIVEEGGLRFEVNLSDYLDTGLFLDQRRVRALIEQEARGRHFLNLYAYTGSASVYAARGGARSTTSVDLSSTYLAWAQRNLQLNGMVGDQHRLVRADCLPWLARQRQRFGLVFVSPPTFSTSKKMEASFDIQRDHLALLNAAARLLEPGGLMVFSTHRQRFHLEESGLVGLAAAEITDQTIPPDFARRPRFHRCWRIAVVD
ncbi:MAG: bifunctional 23S rRNA (guanine(2069)-N(7))-methyltransferase RlmK/23S rRNA (guanine(2445)-N(2))-methyltransferase RlmL [Bradymonadales bacterium]|nr:bifunctional 23S rRNA (guanine(2069)-N(7))-methyltransferase RlmK/23S rRNA (guanine(2445)-N(2))-methyltransferase RlmL [Bradymonadales bacterium]